jgi:hypothetical protein
VVSVSGSVNPDPRDGTCPEPSPSLRHRCQPYRQLYRFPSRFPRPFHGTVFKSHTAPSQTLPKKRLDPPRPRDAHLWTNLGLDLGCPQRNSANWWGGNGRKGYGRCGKGGKTSNGTEQRLVRTLGIVGFFSFFRSFLCLLIGPALLPLGRSDVRSDVPLFPAYSYLHISQIQKVFFLLFFAFLLFCSPSVEAS